MCLCGFARGRIDGMAENAVGEREEEREEEEEEEECDMCSVIDLNSFPETFPGEAGTVLLCSPGLSEPMQNQYPI